MWGRVWTIGWLGLWGVISGWGVQSAYADPALLELCRVTDQRLNELSGLASNGTELFAVNDSDNGYVEIQVLNRDCAITNTITAQANPFDVEDLALASDGTLWLADTGDNRKSRETVALHSIAKNGDSRLYRLSYPDGKHDAETLLLGSDGVPYIVTKEAFGPAGIYRPATGLTASAVVPLEKIGSVSFSTTDTPGGPIESSAVSRVITGGTTSSDNTVIALRTYTDAYLFPVIDNDIAKSLSGDPVRIPLPNEPQGEALAFDPNGTLLSASEFGDNEKHSTIRQIPNATKLVTVSPVTQSQQPEAVPNTKQQAEQSSKSDNTAIIQVLIGGGIVVGAIAFFRRRRS